MFLLDLTDNSASERADMAASDVLQGYSITVGRSIQQQMRKIPVYLPDVPGFDGGL
jgi:hypothetical protein